MAIIYIVTSIISLLSHRVFQSHSVWMQANWAANIFPFKTIRHRFWVHQHRKTNKAANYLVYKSFIYNQRINKYLKERLNHWIRVSSGSFVNSKLGDNKTNNNKNKKNKKQHKEKLRMKHKMIIKKEKERKLKKKKKRQKRVI